MGALITFEGLDGAGKTTQVRLLTNYLANNSKYASIVIREPGGTSVGEKIRSILLDKTNSITLLTEFLLFSASRAQLTNDVIIPALMQDKTVIMDRFFDSSTAYQGYGRGIDLGVVENINRIASDGLVPDMTFYLQMNPDEIIYRKGLASKNSTQIAERDRMEIMGIEFFQKVRHGFDKIAASDPHRYTVLDATDTVEALHQKIVVVVDKVIESCAQETERLRAYA